MDIFPWSLYNLCLLYPTPEDRNQERANRTSIY